MVPLPHLAIIAWDFDWASLSLASLFHIATTLIILVHCLRTPREPRSTLLWLFIAWSFPVIGALLYVTFGVNRVPEKAWLKQRSDRSFLEAHRERECHLLSYRRSIQDALVTDPPTPGEGDFNRIIDRIAPDHPLLGGNSIQTYLDGPEFYPALFETLRAARHHIHVQSFIIGNDAIGREFFAILTERARAGVQVRVLYDAFGSALGRLSGFFRRYRQTPNLQLIGFTQVNPIKRQFQINLRNHRKLTIVDGLTGFIGGMNLHAAHAPRDHRNTIRDYHFRVDGPITHELQFTFLRDWYYMTDEDAATLLQPAHFPIREFAGTMPMRLLNAGPTVESETLNDACFAALTGARRQILLVTPYLLPPDEILRALRGAALRGVDVRVLVPAKGNHPAVAYASHAIYAQLLAAGVRLFLRRPPFMHAKALLVDDRLAIIGSANMDNRSLRMNYETNLAVLHEGFTTSLKQIVLNDFAQADELDLTTWQRRPVTQQLVESFFNLMSPSL